MLMQGVDPATTSGWLEHANVAFTMKTYVHAQPEAFSQGPQALDRNVGGVKKPKPHRQ
jgi:hypothetical protein